MNRRNFLQSVSLGLLGASASPWFSSLARAATADTNRRRHCILLWMAGGPSQMDTFDMKPGHANGGEFKEVATAAPGLRFSEHLPGLAKHADKLAVVRGLSTKEGDHGRGTYLMRTGHKPMDEQINYPSIGASLGKELRRPKDALPGYVAVAPYRLFNQDAFGPGFLGPKYAPLNVAAEYDEERNVVLRVDDLPPLETVRTDKWKRKVDLWRTLESDFLKSHSSAAAAQAHSTVYESALRLIDSEAAEAFNLAKEPAKVRQSYGDGAFGQGCLMARRLIERGVGFVEVTLGNFTDGSVGWDTHAGNFPAVRQLSGELDTGWSTLLTELADRDLLQDTTILWMGEFGRTPNINNNAGRDHFPGAWSCVFAGGGIQGGGAVGKTSKDGMEVTDGKVNQSDILATLCQALGVDHEKENISQIGRPIALTNGSPIQEILS